MEPGGRGAHFLAGPYPNLNGHSNVSRWAGRVFRPWRPFRNCKTLKGLKSCEKMEHKGQRSRIRAAQHRSLGRPKLRVPKISQNYSCDLVPRSLRVGISN